MGCKRLRIFEEPILQVIHRKKKSESLKKCIDYYPFGMPMPNLNVQGDYRYAFQGQEKDPETGKEAFELRLWDSRIGRWLTTDPYSQYYSPYMGMGNNPVNGVDPDGGCFVEIGDKTVPCQDQGYIEGAVVTGTAGYQWENTATGFVRLDGYEALITVRRPRADGGPFDGMFLDQLGTRSSSSMIERSNINISHVPDRSVGTAMARQVAHLGEATDINTTMAVIATVYSINRTKRGASSGETGTDIPIGIGNASPVAILGILAGKQNVKISNDQKELLSIGLRYAQLVENSAENQKGVFIVSEHSGNMLIPFSDKVIVDVYDAHTGKHLGGLSKSAFYGF